MKAEQHKQVRDHLNQLAVDSVVSRWDVILQQRLNIILSGKPLAPFFVLTHYHPRYPMVEMSTYVFFKPINLHARSDKKIPDLQDIDDSVVDAYLQITHNGKPLLLLNMKGDGGVNNLDDGTYAGTFTAMATAIEFLTLLGNTPKP